MQIEALARKLDKKVRELEEKREELRKVHRDWEDIFQSIGYPTIILDAQYNILSVNKATVKAVGSHSAEELIGRKCYEIFHNTSEPPATCPFTKMFSSSKLEERYMDVEALGGVFHVSCTPVFDEMGNIQKIIHIATDITERKRAEDALRISEEKFRILFENAPLGIGVSTLEGKLLAYNEVISEITGYTKEDLLNFNVINLYQNPEDRKALLKELQSNGYVRNYEVLLKRKDGIPFYANITINMITVDGKNALLTVIEDVTERKKAEETLQKKKEFSDSLINSMLDGFSVLDSHGVHINVNPALCQMTGFSKVELIGSGVPHPYWPPEEYKKIEEVFRKTLKGEFTDFELIFMRKNGERFTVIVSPSWVKDKQGNVISYFETVMDITERKQAEDLIRQSEEKYRSLFEDSKDVVYISTIEGKFLDINSAGVALFGYDSKEELLKVDIAKDLYLNPYDRKKFIQTMQQQGFVKDYELLMKRKDGEILTLLSTATPYRDKEGKITEYRGIIRDVTQQRKLEQQLLQAQKMETVGQLAGGIAHDFNNILQAIIGYGSLLQMKIPKNDPLRHNVDQILASSERAASLTHGLLAFSRRQIINLKPVKLNEIVRRVEKLLLRLISEDIELRIILYPTTPLFDKGGIWGVEDLTVTADSSQIEQVLMNLANNARDAMPDGGLLTMGTELVELGEEYIKTYGYGKPGMYALISVTDTGEGMDENIREKIFEPFFTTKEVGKGTGLGLSMVYGIIKQHNGYINVYSELGKGTTFKIYLPLTTSEVEERKPTETTITIGGTETILLAEDDADVRTFTKSVLEEFGYTVIEAGNGEDAVKRFIENKDKVQLLLLDVIMPKKNGKEVYEEIRKTRPEIKALFMSGYAANTIQKEGILEEGLKFVLKPISPTKLLRKVREVLGN